MFVKRVLFKETSVLSVIGESGRYHYWVTEVGEEETGLMFKVHKIDCEDITKEEERELLWQ